VTTKRRLIRSTAACLAILVLSTIALPQTTDPPQEPDKDKKEKRKAEKPYALIFGTAYGPDDRPLYGVRITIRPTAKKRPSWELISDHRGEFAQRVPPGPSDFVVRGEAVYAPAGPDGKPQMSKKKRLTGETKIHVESQERLDISLHLTE
jgi:hypothetical protein